MKRRIGRESMGEDGDVGLRGKGGSRDEDSDGGVGYSRWRNV